MRAAKGTAHADSAFSASISSARLGPVRAPFRGVQTPRLRRDGREGFRQPIIARYSRRGTGGAASLAVAGLEPPARPQPWALDCASPGPWPGRIALAVRVQETPPRLSPVQLLGSSGLKQVDLGPSSPPAATGPHARLHTYPSDRKHAGPAQPPPPTSHLHRQAGRRGQHPAFLRRGSRVPGEPAGPLVPPRPLLPSAAS